MRHNSYWEADLQGAPPAGELERDVETLIVGAGFMGRWLAYFLRPRKRTGSVAPRIVQVLERDGFSYGASSRNAGFLTCGQISEMLADVEHAGIEPVIENFMRRRRGIAIVRREFPQLEFDPCGSFDYDPVTPQSRELPGQLNVAAGEKIYSVRTANLGGRQRAAHFNSADGGVNPVKLLQALQEASPHAKYAFGVNVQRIGDGRAEVLVAGRRLEMRYERAFICTNAFAAELEQSSPVVPGRGQVIVTSPVSTQTSPTLGYINQGYDYFRFVDHRLLIGGGRNRFPAETGNPDMLTTVHVREYLEQQAALVLGHGDFTIDWHWAGMMGFIGGQHLGGSPRRKLDERTEVIAGFGGMGVALTPLYASDIARG